MPTAASGCTPNSSHLFEPFNRLGREKSAIEDTGIGLVIAKSMVELTGGTLTARSWPGHGSEFTVCLLCAGDVPDQHAAVVTDATEATGVTGVADARPEASDRVANAALRGSVVYIDDDEVNCVLMQAFLTLRPGVDLHLAADGRTGLEAVAADPPETWC